MPGKLPVVFVWDMDETMVGITTPLSSLVNFHEFLYNQIKLQNLPPAQCNGKKIRKLHLHDILPKEMLRPGLSEAFSKIKKYFPTAEFFVYSAGTAPYVTDTISWVEKQIGITFRRPLLTRSDTFDTGSSTYVKSIKYQLPAIISSLIKDYPALKNLDNQEELVKSRIIHIDDRPDILWEGSAKLITCPAYSYTPVIDLTQGLERCILESENVKDYLRREEDNNAFVEPLASEISCPEERELRYHVFMAEKCRQVLNGNKEQLQDSFAFKFVKAVKALKHLKRPFTDENVRKLNHLINQ